MKSPTATENNDTRLALERRRARSFAALISKRSTAIRDENDLNENLDLMQEQTALQKIATEANMIEFLTPEEEAQFQLFYERKVQESCSLLFRTSDKVKSSATQLFKRFYLSNSVMEFHPKFLVPTAVYVAAKVEEQYISVETISEQLKVDHKQVIGHEMILLEGVRFQLIMYHPFRPLLAFVDDLRLYYKTQEKELPLEALQSLHTTACAIIYEMQLTDITFQYYPAFIALASLCEAAKQLEQSKDCTKALRKEVIISCIQHNKSMQAEMLKKVNATLEQIAASFAKHNMANGSSGGPESDNESEKVKAIKSIYKKVKQIQEMTQDIDESVSDKKKKKKPKSSKSFSKRKRTQK